MDRFVLSFIVMFAAIDASFRALNGQSKHTDGPTCPHCGRELDVELSFCHWCTNRLEPRESVDSE